MMVVTVVVVVAVYEWDSVFETILKVDVKEYLNTVPEMFLCWYVHGSTVVSFTRPPPFIGWLEVISLDGVCTVEEMEW